MLSFQNPYIVRIDLRTAAGPQSQSDSQTGKLTFGDLDGRKYEFTAVIDAKSEDSNFSVTGLEMPLNVHRSDTSGIVYGSWRNHEKMICKDEDENTEVFVIDNNTRLVIQKWFAQFTRNDEGSWMPQCKTVDGYKRYCGHFHEEQGTDLTNGKRRREGLCSPDNGQCNSCYAFQEKEFKTWQENRLAEFNTWNSSKVVEFLRSKDCITEDQKKELEGLGLNAGDLIAEFRRICDASEDQKAKSKVLMSIQNGGCGLHLHDIYVILKAVGGFIKSEQRL
jgi:hypothetical protein